MSHPLDAANLKVVWAEKHLEVIKNEIARYINEDPHELRSFRDVKDRWRSAPAITIQPDDTLALMVGDCLTNTRAALDYVMFQIVMKWFDPPFDIGNRDHRMVSAFPLFEQPTTDPQAAEPQRFAKLKALMPNVPADVLNAIKVAQPYNSGYLPLWWLHELVNADKHRLLLIAKSDIPSSFFVVHLPGQYIVAHDTDSLDHGDILRMGGLSTSAIGAELPQDVDLQYHPTIHVTFKDLAVPIPEIKHIPIDSVLQQIIETVRTVLPQFDKSF